eukprot:GHVU01177780.1.p1 GENE.GHVU01177780.1~~GHVU01177780.1.p1  ORF type:complete len:326 (+),score=70.12 GHVU01177780.1:280-1257(+)
MSIPEGDTLLLMDAAAASADELHTESTAESVIARIPDWQKYEKVVLPEGARDLLRQLHGMTMQQRADAVCDPRMAALLLSALTISDARAHAVQYVLTLLHAIFRHDCSKVDSFCEATRGQDLLTVFRRLLGSSTADRYTADRGAWLLSSFMSRGPQGMFPLDSVKALTEHVSAGRYPVSIPGKLDCLGNLLKNDGYRDIVWGCEEARQTMAAALQSSSPSMVYRGAFCLWLLTYRTAFIPKLVDMGLIAQFCDILAHCKSEKVVRVSTEIIENIMKCDRAVEVVIEANTQQTMTLIEYEKWRDPDVYEAVRHCLYVLNHTIKEFR